MYGTDEHRAAVRRIGAISKIVDSQYDALESLRDDLRQDDLATTQGARDALRGARYRLHQALSECDKAVAMLPTPASVQR